MSTSTHLDCGNIKMPRSIIAGAIVSWILIIGGVLAGGFYQATAQSDQSVYIVKQVIGTH